MYKKQTKKLANTVNIREWLMEPIGQKSLSLSCAAFIKQGIQALALASNTWQNKTAGIKHYLLKVNEFSTTKPLLVHLRPLITVCNELNRK